MKIIQETKQRGWISCFGQVIPSKAFYFNARLGNRSIPEVPPRAKPQRVSWVLMRTTR